MMRQRPPERSPLHTFAGRGDAEAVRRLLDSGVPVDLRDSQGATALLSASLNGRTNVVRLLLLRGADPDARDVSDIAPLDYALFRDRPYILRFLIEAGADVNYQRTSEYGPQFTPLMQAVSQNQIASARLLLEAGADVNASAESGYTPYRLVIVRYWARSPELRDLLKAYGVRIDPDENLRWFREQRLGDIFGYPVMDEEGQRRLQDIRSILQDLGVDTDRGDGLAYMNSLRELLGPLGSLRQFEDLEEPFEEIETSPPSDLEYPILYEWPIEEEDEEDVFLRTPHPGDGPEDWEAEKWTNEEDEAEGVYGWTGKEYTEDETCQPLFLSSGLTEEGQEEWLAETDSIEGRYGWLDGEPDPRDREELKWIWQNSVPSPDWRASDFTAALILAVQKTRVQRVHALLEALVAASRDEAYYKAAINGQDATGGTPLHYAVLCSDGEDDVFLVREVLEEAAVDLIRLLLKYGADPDLPSQGGNKPDPEDEELGAGEEIVDFAPKRRLWLTEIGDMYGATPLMCAAALGDIKGISTLRAAGASVNSVDSLGRSPLHYAVRQGRQAYSIGYEQGPPERRDLLFAQVARTTERLLANGADPNARSAVGGWTPLIEATYNGDTVTARLLLENGADVNASDIDGWTALLWAARLGHADTVALLLSHGANTEQADSQGKTARQHAAPFRKILRMLE